MTPNIDEVLRLEEVTCVRRDKVVLDRVSLSVRAGDWVAIEGARGSGKSLLLAVAAAAIAPRRGSVLIGGRNWMDLQASSVPFVRRNIGYLPAEPVLIEHETALENVVLPLAVRGVAVDAALARANLEPQRMGLQGLAHEPIAALSPSERRLVAIARALIGAPVVVVLDEPAGGLDRDDRQRIVEAIGVARAAGAAVLCGSADASFVSLLQSHGAERLALAGGRLNGGSPRMVVVEGTRNDSAPTPIRREDSEQILDDADIEAVSP
ncbi:MAG: ATP-binding cassette domain-containing protein [Deltaproteobacteria bacterium]|nr:ATP-binding cassette domain-containing protein [Deltaproteobacteria bacterium]